MMTNESLRRIVSESPVHGPILLDELARLRAKFQTAADMMHSRGYMQENHKAGGYTASCSACAQARKILRLAEEA